MACCAAALAMPSSVVVYLLYNTCIILHLQRQSKGVHVVSQYSWLAGSVMPFSSAWLALTLSSPAVRICKLYLSASCMYSWYCAALCAAAMCWIRITNEQAYVQMHI